jgi:hypothetical protein
MKKYGYVVLAAIAAVAVSLGLSSAAQAYPDIRVDLTVNHKVLYSGESFTATGVSSVDCALDLEWDHVVRQSAPAKRFVTSYVAPQVTKVTKIPLNGVCRYTTPAGGSSSAKVSTLRSRITVTVLPRANGATPPPVDNSADLPGTGGPNRVFLLSGLVLLLAGATAVTVARRRAEDVELPGQTA